MLPYNQDTAILFLVFNRPHLTSQVFQKIRSAKPARLYIAADGPRTEDEAAVCEAVRAIIKDIDWDCELHTRFRDTNLGCKTAVSDGINWLFDHEEQGIILEDDCLPSDSFFGFCTDLLEKYKDDPRIAHISGANFQDGVKRGDASYYFSSLTHVWGWASWRRVWKNYDASISSFPTFNPEILANIPSLAPFTHNWMHILTRVYQGDIDTWDYQYAYLNINERALSIIPNQNLIRNIGFGLQATNTTGEQAIGNSELNEIHELVHPLSVSVDVEADLYTQAREFTPASGRKKNILSRIWKTVKRYLNNR